MKSLTSRRQLLGGLLMLPLTALHAAAPTAEGPRPPPATLRKAGRTPARVDAAGFIRRWTVLDPISVSGQLTQPAIESVIEQWRLPGDEVPTDGQQVTLGGDQSLTWHALDTTLYNLNLYHFAWSRGRPTSNVLFWAHTVIETSRALRDARLSIGSNAASVWWLDGQRVISLYNDRQTVIDDGVSRRLTLAPGRHVIRAAIINGGGATDFCARVLDARDRPITDLTVRSGD
jgi:hypothetical protein